MTPLSGTVYGKMNQRVKTLKKDEPVSHQREHKSVQLADNFTRSLWLRVAQENKIFRPSKMNQDSVMFYSVFVWLKTPFIALSPLLNACSLGPPPRCVLVETETRCLTSPPSQCMLGNSQWGLGTHKHTVLNTHSKRHTCFNISMVILIILTHSQSVC